jgi:hypothetical protein
MPLGGAVVAVDELSFRRVIVPFAPPHDGLEGRPLRVVIVPTNTARLRNEDRLGGTRVVLVVEGPAPDRSLLVRAPRPLPVGEVVGSGFDTVVDAIGVVDDELGGLQHDVRVQLGDGRLHDLRAPADAALNLGALLLEIEDAAGVDVDANSIDVGARLGGDDEVRPWASASRTRRR